MSRGIKERAEEISQIALDHGWDAPTWDNFLAKLMLIMTEVQEAEDAQHDHPAFMLELADVVIRTLDVVHTLDVEPTRAARKKPLPVFNESNVLLGTRRYLSRAAEWYRRGLDEEALCDLWEAIAGIECWCTANCYDLWDAVDKKIAVNRTRPRLHGKKRSIG
jgi:hypothetical protein